MDNREAVEASIEYKVEHGYSNFFEEIGIAFQALEEVGQYRQLGTLEQVREAMRKVSRYDERRIDCALDVNNR